MSTRRWLTCEKTINSKWNTYTIIKSWRRNLWKTVISRQIAFVFLYWHPKKISRSVSVLRSSHDANLGWLPCASVASTLFQKFLLAQIFLTMAPPALNLSLNLFFSKSPFKPSRCYVLSFSHFFGFFEHFSSWSLQTFPIGLFLSMMTFSLIILSHLPLRSSIRVLISYQSVSIS